MLVFTYGNPVIRGELSDPSAIRLSDSDYFVTATPETQSRGIFALFHSSNLIDWSIDPKHPAIFHSPPDQQTEFWSPNLSFWPGQGYYLFYSARIEPSRIHGLFVSKSVSPLGPWSPPKPFLDHANEPEVARNRQGTPFLFWTEDNPPHKTIKIWAAQLSNDGSAILADTKTQILSASAAKIDEIHGPIIYKSPSNDEFYLFFFGGSCCNICNYVIFATRSSNLLGPYEPPRALVFDRQSSAAGSARGGSREWHCFGTGSVVNLSDNVYLIYDGVRKEYANLPHELLLSQISFSRGWPRLTLGQPDEPAFQPRWRARLFRLYSAWFVTVEILLWALAVYLGFFASGGADRSIRC